MGLDMIPMGKPKPGFEERFEQLFRIIQGKEKQKLSFFDKLRGRKLPTQDESLEEWFSIQIPSYETIKAPQVGRDKEADEWIKEKYLQSDRSMAEDDFIREQNGYYVIELAKEKDGVPVYISMQQDENVFRGQFLQDCINLIGQDLVNEAWETKLAHDTLTFGHQLLATAERIARENNLEYLKEQRKIPVIKEDSIESALHIVYSLAKWLIFYGKNGHGYEADF